MSRIVLPSAGTPWPGDGATPALGPSERAPLWTDGLGCVGYEGRGASFPHPESAHSSTATAVPMILRPMAAHPKPRPFPTETGIPTDYRSGYVLVHARPPG